MIQEGFDKGFALGSVLEVLQVLESHFKTEFNQDQEEADNDNKDNEDTPDNVLERIEKLRMEMEEKVPEIKIATNLYNAK